jgi:hypothetical protein
VVTRLAALLAPPRLGLAYQGRPAPGSPEAIPSLTRQINDSFHDEAKEFTLAMWQSLKAKGWVNGEVL